MFIISLIALATVVQADDERIATRRRIYDEMPPAVREFYAHPDPPITGILDEVRAIRGMKPELRTMAIEFYRKAAYSSPDLVDTDAEEYLYALGDEPTMKKFVRKYFEEGNTDYGFALREGGNPDVIALIGPYLLRTDDFPNAPGFSVGFMAMLRLGELLDLCENFPPEVLAWIKQVYPRSDKTPECVTRWWLQNKDALIAHQYDKVRPGPVPAQEDGPAAVTDLGKAVTPSKSTPATTAVPVQGVVPFEQSRVWFTVAATIVVFFGAALWWRRRK